MIDTYESLNGLNFQAMTRGDINYRQYLANRELIRRGESVNLPEPPLAICKCGYCEFLRGKEGNVA